MMDYHDMGWTDGGWIFMWVFMATLWITIIGLAAWIFAAVRREDGRDRERPEDTLARRLAAGEIDEATYRRLYDEIYARRTPLSPSG